jgi:hypothetical protein
VFGVKIGLETSSPTLEVGPAWASSTRRYLPCPMLLSEEKRKTGNASETLYVN